MNVEMFIESAYRLYMPQDNYEITELARFVSEQVQKDKPYNILEIGTKYGGTFYIWNKIVEEHGAGMCISIDMSDGGLHGGVSDADMDRRDFWFQELFSSCHFIRGDSHSISTLNSCTEHLMNVISVIEPKIDFLFIDGDHTYEGVKQDFEMYSPLVKEDGIIAFHDINDSQRHRDRNVYVGKFWNEVKYNTNYEAVEFNSNLDWAGIGVLIKK